MRRIYLDHSATTPVDPQVVSVMNEFMLERFGNPSSVHSFGREAFDAVGRARQTIAGILGAESEEIVFTSGGTEADNLALIGYALKYRGKGDHIVTTQIEHSAILGSAHELELQGFSVTRLRPDSNGEISPVTLAKAMTERTILVSVMHANNEVGTVNDISALAKITHSAGAAFHTDAVQSFGKLPISVTEMGIDLLSLSGHKIYGPKGIGALYLKRGIDLYPRQFGGHQESGVRSGTENVPGIIGLAKAAELSTDEMASESARLTLLRLDLLELLKTALSDIILNGHPDNRIPGNLNLTFKGVEAEALLVALDLEGIAVSSGSACSSGSTKPSHVLTAIGLSDADAHGTIRITLGRSTTNSDIQDTAKILTKAVKRLREMA